MTCAWPPVRSTQARKESGLECKHHKPSSPLDQSAQRFLSQVHRMEHQISNTLVRCSTLRGRSTAWEFKLARRHEPCTLCRTRLLRALHRCPDARLHTAYATVGEGGSGDDEEPLDIDALAKRLSQEAERLRRSESGKDASTSFDVSNQAAGQDPIFGGQALKRQAEFLDNTEGGFVANEFEILQQLGRLSWVTEGAKESPLQVTATSTEQVQAVVAFAARYYSGGPFQEPVRVLLKEFLPAAKPVGCNELLIASALSGWPQMKWQAAAAALSSDPPVVPILGYFMAGQSDTGVLLSQEDMQMSDTQEALWLVYKWENLQPIAFYPGAEQPRFRAGLQFWGADTESQALRARCRMLRQMARGALQAVAYCHSKGIAHGSLGAGSVVVNTFDDRQADSLVVKITNFGFAQQFAADDSISELGMPPHWQKNDLQAIGIVILEAIFSALAEGGPCQATSAEALKRLTLEVFGNDIDQFRQYLEQETNLMAPTALLDQFGSSGWAMISLLLSSQRTAADLLATNSFVNVGAD